MQRLCFLRKRFAEKQRTVKVKSSMLEFQLLVISNSLAYERSYILIGSCYHHKLPASALKYLVACTSIPVGESGYTTAYAMPTI